MTGADSGQPGGLVLADFVCIHAVPQGSRVNAAGLGGFDPGRAVQRLLHQRLDRRAHVPFAPGHLGHVAGTHPHVFRQALEAHALLTSALPDVAALGPPFHHSALPVGATGGPDLHRTAQRLLDPRLDRRAHVLPAPRDLRHIPDRHPNPVGKVLLGQAQLPGALPDAGALTLHEAALPVDDALAGDLAQHRRGPFPQHGSPGPAPAGHRGEVAIADAHQVRQLLEGEAVPPGRSPELALGLALARFLFLRLSLGSLYTPRTRCGVLVALEPGYGMGDDLGAVDLGSCLHVTSSETQKAGPPSR